VRELRIIERQRLLHPIAMRLRAMHRGFLAAQNLPLPLPVIGPGLRDGSAIEAPTNEKSQIEKNSTSFNLRISLKTTMSFPFLHPFAFASNLQLTIATRTVVAEFKEVGKEQFNSCKRLFHEVRRRVVMDATDV